MIVACESKYRCKCIENPPQIRCKANATEKDLSASCDQSCANTVTDLYVHSPSQCLKNLRQKCPQIKNVLIDNATLCDCYCNISGITVKPSVRSFPQPCSCFSHETTTTATSTTRGPFITTTIDPSSRGGIHISNTAIMIIGSSVIAIILISVTVVAIVRYRHKLVEFYQRRVRNGSIVPNDDASPIFNEPSQLTY
uniref:Uncharacterized protein n=1 Tax=Romanomermis culicivorax TaxID=13658 RepID=A0A915K4V5_ROMCU